MTPNEVEELRAAFTRLTRAKTEYMNALELVMNEQDVPTERLLRLAAALNEAHHAFMKVSAALTHK